ncbi:Histone acetyl transferase HAT1 N-terminus [Nakaseomyces glabratus]
MSIDDFKPEKWTISSNEALKLSLVSEDNAIQFSPTFTYPIFGTEEQIFGYKDLVIHLAFDAITFKPFLNVKFSSKFEGSEEELVNIKEKLLEYLPIDDTIYKDEEKWIDSFKKEQESIEAYKNDQNIDEYKIDNADFEIYKVNLQDPKMKRFHRRIQIFSLLFIEAASYIDEDDPKWEIFIVQTKKDKKFVGYATAYNYWYYPGANNFDSESKYRYRGKISQFLILPPYQGRGHGSHLYNSIVKNWRNDSSILEIVVEDPNESFDDLRDVNDLEMLYKDGFFNKLPQETPIPNAWIESTRLKYKIEKRQFSRLLEMILLSTGSNNFEYQVKQRLLIKNKDGLEGMEVSDIKDALNKSFESLREDYDRILGKCQFSNDADGPSKKKIKT